MKNLKCVALFALISTTAVADLDHRYVCDSRYDAVEYSVTGTFVHGSYSGTGIDADESTARSEARNTAYDSCRSGLGSVYSCSDRGTSCRRIDP